MNRESRLPFYAKAAILIIGLYTFISMLSIGRSLILPLLFSFLIAVILHPLESFLVKIGINRVVAITLTLIITILVVTGLGYFISLQFIRFSEAFPALVEKFETYLNDATRWLSDHLNISTQRISDWITTTKNDMFDNSAPAIGKTLVTIGNLLVVVLLVPVYIFMILYYKPILLEFIRLSFDAPHRIKVSKIISEVKAVIQGYLTGLFIEMLIVAVLNTCALLVLGVDYAVLLGIIGALLNLIPYIGGITAVILPMMISLVTNENQWTPLYVLALYYLIQLIDNNYIVPKIVASKVKLNALVSIFVVLAFGALWGIPGMFISIPLTAIIKLIADHIEPLKPLGFLLGDSMPRKGPYTPESMVAAKRNPVKNELQDEEN